MGSWEGCGPCTTTVSCEGSPKDTERPPFSLYELKDTRRHQPPPNSYSFQQSIIATSK